MALIVTDLERGLAGYALTPPSPMPCPCPPPGVHHGGVAADGGGVVRQQRAAEVGGAAGQGRGQGRAKGDPLFLAAAACGHLGGGAYPPVNVPAVRGAWAQARTVGVAAPLPVLRLTKGSPAFVRRYTGEMGVLAVIPLVAFFGFDVLNKDDFNSFLWNVVMLAMGGLALGEEGRGRGGARGDAGAAAVAASSSRAA